MKQEPPIHEEISCDSSSRAACGEISECVEVTVKEPDYIRIHLLSPGQFFPEKTVWIYFDSFVYVCVNRYYRITFEMVDTMYCFKM